MKRTQENLMMIMEQGPQATFDYIVNVLVKQGPCVRGKSGCWYRMDDVDGPACGVGLCIPDDDYYSSMESLSPSELVEEIDFFKKVSVKWGYSLEFFFEELQDAHDNWATGVWTFNRAFHDAASNLGLHFVTRDDC